MPNANDVDEVLKRVMRNAEKKEIPNDSWMAHYCLVDWFAFCVANAKKD